MWQRTSDPWLDMIQWKACGGQIDAESLEGRTCCGGLDLSTVKDLSAFVLAFRCAGPEDGRATVKSSKPADIDATPIDKLDDDDDSDKANAIYTLLPFFWLPADGIRVREQQDRVPYRQWADRGFLSLTPGNTIDYAFIEHAIKPVKPDRNRGSKRIDGIVAAITAMGRETLRERSESVYERRRLLVIDF